MVHRQRKSSPKIRARTNAVREATTRELHSPLPDDNYQYQAAIAAMKEEDMSDPSPITLAIRDLNSRLTDLEKLVKDLQERQINSDPLDDSVLEVFQRVAPMKLSYTDVAEELGAEPNNVHRSVRRLERAGRLQVHEKRAEGSTRTFRKWNVTE